MTITPTWDGALTRGPVHGPLPILLLLLTFSTGAVDAVSVLSLGRVFVANMTGNIVFIGFALAGAPGFALAASLAALAGFLVGALAGGVVVTRFRARRGRLLLVTVLVEVLLVAVAVVLLALGLQVTSAGASGVAVLLALALGLQNTTVRHLAVPDLTTTVLTMTITGIGADVRRSGVRVLGRRLLAVGTMLVGALVGALLVLSAGPVWALVPVLVAGVVVAGVLGVHERRPVAAWQSPT
ncbi:YoaK family protein [Actinomycetospora sp. CA-084318]|uniref:YoaK family protein n=1 Tax=Actinomycetospora sp. CA-084318 TaxID=3239892 RepID=UPI003D96FAFE